MVGEKKKQN